VDSWSASVRGASVRRSGVTACSNTGHRYVSSVSEKLAGRPAQTGWSVATTVTVCSTSWR
jgi:hypothetical protein